MSAERSAAGGSPAGAPVFTVPGPPSATRLVLTLFVAGMLSGSALAGVYVLSAPRIADNRAAALAQAVLAVLPGAVRFEPHRMPDGMAGVYAAYGEHGDRLGYAVQAEGPGFMDTIVLIYGFQPAARRVVGLQILDSRETPGLGDKIMTDPAFVGSFKQLSVVPAIAAKTDGPRTGDNEVDCISGATISSKAVVHIVQASVERVVDALSDAAHGGGVP